jgi:hypothetical protein
MAASRSDPSPVEEAPTQHEVSTQVERLLSSVLFQNSDSTRRLLLFLADWSASHPAQPVKEIEIAVSVYNRSPDTFDSQIDSKVRVHIGRLRSKILEYYATTGQDDEILLEIPKGAYYLASRYRRVAAAASAEAVSILQTVEALDVETPTTPASESFRSLTTRWGLPMLFGVVIGCLLTRFALPSRPPLPPPSLAQFWSSFANKEEPTMVVFSNPRLAGTLSTQGLRYYNEEKDAGVRGAENLTYAGSGDVRAVFTLARVFDKFGIDARLQSGALLSWDEAKTANLVFIGRPEQNPALYELPRLHSFYFKYGVGIVNAHPEPGEKAVYGLSPRPYNLDHAVIAFVPGVQAQRNTLVLAGNSTYGSQAAAEFLARDASAKILLDRLSVSKGGKLPYFEAVLEVRIANETPVHSQIVAIRRSSNDATPWEPPATDER